MEHQIKPDLTPFAQRFRDPEMENAFLVYFWQRMQARAVMTALIGTSILMLLAFYDFISLQEQENPLVIGSGRYATVIFAIALCIFSQRKTYSPLFSICMIGVTLSLSVRNAMIAYYEIFSWQIILLGMVLQIVTLVMFMPARDYVYYIVIGAFITTGLFMSILFADTAEISRAYISIVLMSVLCLFFVWQSNGSTRQQYFTLKQLESATHEAEGANKAKSQFLATMSHEIRTPLNGILGMATSLVNADLPNEQKEQAQIILNSGDHLLGLLGDILDISKIEAGRLETEEIDFNLGTLLQAVKDVWRFSFDEKSIAFYINSDLSVSPILLSDPARIRQILNNFLSNALKFTDRGSVTVDVRQKLLSDGRIETRFDVRDTGIGIADDAVPNVFETFTQAERSTTRRYGGSGLGLAICKELTHLLGGQIGVESQLGRGSHFWFTVHSDLITERRDHPQNDLPVSDQLPLVGNVFAAISHVLVVDDNTVNQMVLRTMLARLGFVIETAENGEDAVKAAMSQPFDLIFMDIEMPVMNGLDAARAIRGLSAPIADVPIIAVTANALEGDRETYLDAGMDDYITKPIDVRSLALAIIRAFEKRHALKADDSDGISHVSASPY